MIRTIWSSIQPLMDWAVKYWPVLAAIAGGLWYLIQFWLRRRRDNRDKQVLEILVPKEPLFFRTKMVITLDTDASIAQKLHRSVESVSESLNRLREKGLAVSESGFWYRG